MWVRMSVEEPGRVFLGVFGPGESITDSSTRVGLQDPLGSLLYVHVRSRCGSYSNTSTDSIRIDSSFTSSSSYRGKKGSEGTALALLLALILGVDFDNFGGAEEDSLSEESSMTMFRAGGGGRV